MSQPLLTATSMHQMNSHKSHTTENATKSSSYRKYGTDRLFTNTEQTMGISEPAKSKCEKTTIFHLAER